MVSNKLDVTLARVKKSGRKALVAYIAAGYPSFKEQTKLIEGMVDSGVDVLEIGIPFSDPVADGPTIQFASYQSLKAGTSVKKILPWVKTLTRRINAPVLFMTYLNPIVAYGFKKFAAQAAAAGVTGLIVPDLVPEEARDIARALADHNMHLIHLVAPTTPSSRQRTIARQTGGFLYAVSVTGVTGARRTMSYSPATKAWLRSLKKMSSHPVCVGFGIAGREQIRSLKDSVDGFIVGSAIVDTIRNNRPARRKAELNRFIRGLAKECARGR
jgi:tryptophan synthase alpha chain